MLKQFGSRKAPAAKRANVCVHAGARNGATVAPVSPLQNGGDARFVIHEIPQSQWPKGVPAVMGAHLMASGAIAPISTSRGPGEGNVPHMFEYHSAEHDVNVVQYDDAEGAGKSMASLVVELANSAISEKGCFTVTLSGGSLLKALSQFAGAETDFSKWWVFFVDERNVPHSSEDSTYKGAKEAFLDAVDIPAEQVFAIQEGLSAAEAAKNYEGRMLAVPKEVLPRSKDNWPVIDCMLLGVGPDGHIASLFPNSPQLANTDTWVVPVEDSPKPPPERITMTLPLINAARCCIFLATGSGKAEIVQRVLECQSLPGALPAQLVRPTEGSVFWLLDSDSAAKLQPGEWKNKKAYPRSQIA